MPPTETDRPTEAIESVTLVADEHNLTIEYIVPSSEHSTVVFGGRLARTCKPADFVTVTGNGDIIVTTVRMTGIASLTLLELLEGTFAKQPVPPEGAPPGNGSSIELSVAHHDELLLEFVCIRRMDPDELLDADGEPRSMESVITPRLLGLFTYGPGSFCVIITLPLSYDGGRLLMERLAACPELVAMRQNTTRHDVTLTVIDPPVEP